jgi:hypothetical protein
MHKIQRVILRRLLTNNGQKYSFLTQGYSYEDNVVFHLKQLLNYYFIKKQDSQYFITTKGTREITKYDLESLEDTGFKTFFVGFICKCKDEYLIKEHPNGKNNFYNLPSGKPMFGENTNKFLVRIFYENTGLKLNPEYFKHISLHLKTIKTSSGETLFDDAFAIFEVLVDSDLKEKMKLAKYIDWYTLYKIKKLKNIWPEINILLIKKRRDPYLSYEFISDYVL